MEKKIKRNLSDRVLSIRDLHIEFETNNSVLKAIRGIDFDLFKNETVAIVGESGSGKSVTMKAIMGIMAKNGKITNGSIKFWDRWSNDELYEITTMNNTQIRNYLSGKKIAMIFQDPMTSLDPTMKIGKQIRETILYHNKNISKAEAKKMSIKYLEDVGINRPEMVYNQYPNQLSGGMRQRVVIAIALSCQPQILICDEPTTALDVTVQDKILNLIKEIQEKNKLSVIFITHDLGVVAKVADYVAVMYAGKIVEKGSVNEIFYDPRHPYTWGLLSSMPDLNTKEGSLHPIPGTPVDLFKKIEGDAFAPRNPYALNIDFKQFPPQYNVGGKHRVSSWLLDERAPHVEMPDELKERIEIMKKEAGL
ncbi:ABC transporter ATP-binding protein [Peptoniphilaceae bacterium SGI.131]